MRDDCGDSGMERRGFPGRWNLGMGDVGISESGPFNERIDSMKARMCHRGGESKEAIRMDGSWMCSSRSPPLGYWIILGTE